MKIKTNLVSGIIFIVLSVILLLLVPSQIVVSKNIPFLESARAAPILAIAVMLIGGVSLTIQSLVLKKETVVEIHFEEQKYALYVMFTIILYAALIYFAGYIIASVVMVGILYKFYNVRNLFQLAVLILIAVGVYLLFTNIFHVSLPGIGGV